MPDKYEQVRSLPFPALASALGLDLQRFKTRKDGEYYGPCPVHQPKNNSTSFSYAADGRFNCFSCSAKGRGAIDLFKLVKDVGFQGAVEALGTAPTTEPPKQKTAPSANSDATDGVLKPFTGKYDKFAVPCPWLEQRIPDAAIRERYGVFCYNNPARKSAFSGRVMIPIKDQDGTLLGYLGRSILDNHKHSPDTNSDIPKYLFPRGVEKSKFLFGAHELAQHLQDPDRVASRKGDRRLKVVYLVESPFCVMKFATWGLPALSPFGWSVSEDQRQLLATLTKGIVFLPDRNKSDECASVVVALANGHWVRFPPLPAGIDDPEYLSREQVLAL